MGVLPLLCLMADLPGTGVEDLLHSGTPRLSLPAQSYREPHRAVEGAVRPGSELAGELNVVSLGFRSPDWQPLPPLHGMLTSRMTAWA